MNQLLVNELIIKDENDFESMILQCPGHVYWKDINGVYLGCNLNQALSAGFSSIKEIIGKTDYDMPWKKSADNIRRTDEEIINKGIKKTLEEILVFPDNKSRVFLSKKLPLKDKNNVVIGVFGISFDISDIKEYQHELRKDKEQVETTLEHIIAHLPGHVYWKSKEGVYLGCNDKQAKSLGYQKASDVVGKTDFDLSKKIEDALEFRKNDEQVIADGELKVVEEKAKMDGREAIVLSHKLPLRDRNDEIIGIVGVSFDITERKKYEEELNSTLLKLSMALEAAEEANRAKSNFLTIMSHELTNFVGTVKSSLDLIKMLIPNRSNDIEKYLNICTESLNHILPFIQDVTKYFQIEAGGIKSKIGLAKITDTFNAVINNQKEIYKNVDVQLNIHNSLKDEILIDNLNLFKILTIVIGNAFKFTNKGIVSINASLNNKDLLIEVKDTGIGMHTEQLKNIFNAFPTGSDSSVRYKKFGLKLSIVKKIIELLGGSIHIESTINVGTTVKISLPIAEPNDKSITMLSHDEPLSENINKILVVEDDKRICELIVSLLKALNKDFDIDSVETGTQAINMAKVNKYDLVFLDITLPDISGIEVIENFQKIFGESVPVAAVTSHSSEEAIDEFLSKGFIYVIPKPISIDSFKQFFKDLPKLTEDD